MKTFERKLSLNVEALNMQLIQDLRKALDVDSSAQILFNDSERGL